MSNLITDNFETSSAAEWKQKIQFDLKGADYNETLLTKTLEGITIKPFYHADDFEKLDIPSNTASFKICDTLTIENETETNHFAIESISNGVNAIQFIANKPFNIEVLFNNLLHKNIDFHFQFNFLSEAFIDELSNFLKNENVYLNIDTIGNLAKTGNWFYSLTEDFKILNAIISKNTAKQHLSVNSAIYQNAGANTVQQIAYTLAHANEYLQNLGEKTANKIQFIVAVGSNYFFEIAKLRALKYLFKLLLNEYNVTAEINIFAQPTLRNKTLYDYNVNMLRTTTESMSAILGGANSISNCPYNVLFKKHNNFGSRIARNQLHILKEESYITQSEAIVNNSYYIEEITKQMAEKALDLFKNIEKSGGFLHQLKEGTIQRKIQENATKEQALFDSGELVLLGTNKYPNALDKMKNELETSPFQPKRVGKTLIIPIISKRLAEKLELKRLDDEA